MYRRFYYAYQKRNYYAIQVKPDHITRCSAACSWCGVSEVTRLFRRDLALVYELLAHYTGCLSKTVTTRRLRNYPVHIYSFHSVMCTLVKKLYFSALFKMDVCNGSARYNRVRLTFYSVDFFLIIACILSAGFKNVTSITSRDYKW